MLQVFSDWTCCVVGDSAEYHETARKGHSGVLQMFGEADIHFYTRTLIFC